MCTGSCVYYTTVEGGSWVLMLTLMRLAALLSVSGWSLKKSSTTEGH